MSSVTSDSLALDAARRAAYSMMASVMPRGARETPVRVAT